MWQPRGPKHEENACLCVFFVPRRLQKGPPEGQEHKTLVNNDRIWGVFLVLFSCPLRFLSRGSGFLCGAVLAAPSVPQGCLGDPFWVLLRAARGAQKGPPYRRDSLFLGSLWGPLGCSVRSRTLFFWPILLINSRWAYEVAPQELAWVGCSRFWARSGCGGLAGGRAWGALGASPGASRGLSGAHRDPQGGLQRRLWQLLGDSGDLWGSSRACGPLGGSLWGALGVSGDS